MKKIALFTFATAALALPVLANMNSGLKVGENVSAFHPNHVSGPLANSTNCFPCTFKNRPQVQVWVNGDDMKNVAEIAKVLDAHMVKNKEFKGLIVVLTDKKNASTVKSSLAKAGKVPGLTHVGMAYIDKSDSAVENYKINTDAGVKNTVIAYENWKVAATMVNLKADSKGIADLNRAIADLAK